MIESPGSSDKDCVLDGSGSSRGFRHPVRNRFFFRGGDDEL